MRYIDIDSKFEDTKECNNQSEIEHRQYNDQNKTDNQYK